MNMLFFSSVLFTHCPSFVDFCLCLLLFTIHLPSWVFLGTLWQ